MVYRGGAVVWRDVRLEKKMAKMREGATLGQNDESTHHVCLTLPKQKQPLHRGVVQLCMLNLL